MNIVLFRKEEFESSNIFTVKDKIRIEHIDKVIKGNMGDLLEAGEINGKIGKAEIIIKTKEQISFKFFAEKEPPAKIPVILICAVPRPKFLKRIIKDSVSIGVEKIFFVRTWKVEKSFLESSIFEKDKIMEYIYLGLEQAKDTIIPKIELKKSFKQFIEDELPEIARDAVKIVAHPGGEKICPHSINGKTALFIGPEGGFTDYEIEMIESKEFKRVNIGERILRVETAIPFIIGKLIN